MEYTRSHPRILQGDVKDPEIKTLSCPISRRLQQSHRIFSLPLVYEVIIFQFQKRQANP